MGNLELMPDDEGLSECVEGRLESGPSDDAMEDIGGDVTAVFLLQLDLFQ